MDALGISEVATVISTATGRDGFETSDVSKLLEKLSNEDWQAAAEAILELFRTLYSPRRLEVSL